MHTQKTGDAIHNARVKYRASWWNNISVALFAVLSSTFLVFLVANYPIPTMSYIQIIASFFLIFCPSICCSVLVSRVGSKGLNKLIDHTHVNDVGPILEAVPQFHGIENELPSMTGGYLVDGDVLPPASTERPLQSFEEHYDQHDDYPQLPGLAGFGQIGGYAENAGTGRRQLQNFEAHYDQHDGHLPLQGLAGLHADTDERPLQTFEAHYDQHPFIPLGAFEGPPGDPASG